MPRRRATPRRFAVAAARQVGLLAGVVVMVFLLLRVIPGDTVDVLAAEGDVSLVQENLLRHQFGLDVGWPGQLAAWVASAAHGDLGQSLRYSQPVAVMIGRALPATFQLAGASLAIGLALGVAVAVAALLRPNLAALVETLNLWSVALPGFCVGVGAILLFSVWLGWLPSLGNGLMPALIVGVDIAGQIAKPLLAELQETAGARFVDAARARGVGRLRLALRHVLPNALTAIIPLAGLIVAGLVGGVLTLEVLFGLPGIGALLLDAIRGRDYPLVQAAIVLIAAAVVLTNLLTDALQRWLDPRLP